MQSSLVGSYQIVESALFFRDYDDSSGHARFIVPRLHASKVDRTRLADLVVAMLVITVRLGKTRQCDEGREKQYACSLRLIHSHFL
jgi:hypothetical protein